jgi:cytochrome P450
MTFDVFMKDLLGVLTGMAPEDSRKFGDGYHEWIRQFTIYLSGEHLNLTTSRGLRQTIAIVNDIDSDGMVVDDMFIWLRDKMTVAVSTALWGPENPIKRDPTLVDTYWDFDHGILNLLTGFLPEITASKAYKSRNKLRKAFEAYHAARRENHHEVVPVITQTVSVQKSLGLSVQACAALDLSILLGSLTNTAPATVFLVNTIFGHQDILARLREEAMGAIRTMKCKNGQREMTIIISDIEKKCPLLHTTFKETLRLKLSGSTTRRVMTDTTITDSTGRTYALKKGADVRIMMTTHRESSIWGATVNDFDAEHFLNTETKTEEGKARKRAFFPFGGGKHLCPGRNFATSEVMGTAIALMLSCDITDVDGNPLQDIRVQLPVIGTVMSLPSPLQDLRVRITRRKGWEDVVWTV